MSTPIVYTVKVRVPSGGWIETQITAGNAYEAQQLANAMYNAANVIAVYPAPLKSSWE